ncbi:MAG: hypothetical protein KDA57_13215 [Planctomycetales bacterium]|nr:hypothetical protein [Planctomycetales bacterium]
MKLSAFGLAVVLVVGASLAWAQGRRDSATEVLAEDEDSFSFWMEAKLKKSQDIFAALTEGDYQGIVENAASLKTLSQVEGFVRKRNPEYRTQLRAFEFALYEIQKQAEKENIEGVVLGFNQLTLSCVHCHKQLRDADAEAP